MGRILVVEDDMDIREALADVLRDEGHEVLVAANGVEALSLLAPETPPPCLVLLDLMMPAMNGWEFMSQLRTSPRKDLPVVVLTGAHDGERVARELGAIGAMRKPFEIPSLLEHVVRWCTPQST